MKKKCSYSVKNEMWSLTQVSHVRNNNNKKTQMSKESKKT